MSKKAKKKPSKPARKKKAPKAKVSGPKTPKKAAKKKTVLVKPTMLAPAPAPAEEVATEEEAPPVVTGATIGQRVRNLRIAFGYGQEEIARHIGVGNRTMCRIENDSYKNMRLSTLCLLAEAYDVTTDALLGRETQAAA